MYFIAPAVAPCTFYYKNVALASVARYSAVHVLAPAVAPCRSYSHFIIKMILAVAACTFSLIARSTLLNPGFSGLQAPQESSPASPGPLWEHVFGGFRLDFRCKLMLAPSYVLLPTDY